MVTNRDPDGLASQNNQLNYEVNFCKIDAIKKIVVLYNAHLEIINIYATVKPVMSGPVTERILS